MSILPKLLYVSKNIPLPPPEHFFHKIDKLCGRFIWENKKLKS